MPGLCGEFEPELSSISNGINVYHLVMWPRRKSLQESHGR